MRRLDLRRFGGNLRWVRNLGEKSCAVVDNMSEATDQCEEVETEGLRRQNDDLLASQRLMHSGNPDSATVLVKFASKRSNESRYSNCGLIF